MKASSHGVLRLTSWLLVFVALSGAGLVLSAEQQSKLASKKKRPPPQQHAYRIGAIRGEVILLRGKTQSRLTTEQPIRPGDRIITGNNASALIVGPRGAKAELASVTIVELPARAGRTVGLNLHFGAVLAHAWPKLALGASHSLEGESEPATLDRYLALRARDEDEVAKRLSGILPAPPATISSNRANAAQVLVRDGRLKISETAGGKQPAISLTGNELLRISEKKADFIPAKIGASEASEALRQLGFASAGTQDAVPH